MRSRLSRIRMYADQGLLSEEHVTEASEIMTDHVLDATKSSDSRVAELAEQIKKYLIDIAKIIEMEEQFGRYSRRRFSRRLYSEDQEREEIVNIIKELADRSLERKAENLVHGTAAVVAAPAVISYIILMLYGAITGKGGEVFPGFGKTWGLPEAIMGIVGPLLTLPIVGAFARKIVGLFHSNREKLAEKARIFFDSIKKDKELIKRIRLAYRSKDPKFVEQVLTEIGKKLPR